MIFSSAECRARAGQKLAQAELDKPGSRKLITAAEAWLYLARRTAEVERLNLQCWPSAGGVVH
jgi:hypothetical protein